MKKISYPESIKKTINYIIDQIKAVLDPEYIIITGSFGKGSWIYSDDKLLSDFEFVFISKNKWSLSRKKQLLLNLNSQLSIDISLKGYLLKNVQNKIISNYSFKYPGYIDLSFFDTFSNPSILYSKNKNIISVPDLSVKDIPKWEAWRLIVNRLGDLLYHDMRNYDNHCKQKEYFYWLKAFESCADAYMLVKQIYCSSIEGRKNLIENSFEKTANSNELLIKSFYLLKASIIARSEHDLSKFRIDNLSVEERAKFLNQWVDYIQNEMFEEENICCIKEYLQSKTLQNKYLETNFNQNIVLSNFLRIYKNKTLINSEYKYYNVRYSARHIILLLIRSIYSESTAVPLRFDESKKIASLIFNKNSLSNFDAENFVRFVLRYWKLLR